jgi:RHS repeat-associated protein
MTGDGTNTYTWNARDELASISGAATASFVYDGLGRRRSKTVGGVQTGFVYDRENFVQELNGATITANLVTGGIDELFARKEGATASYPLTDALGSVIGLTDASGVLQTQYSYEPYGKGTRSGATTTNSQTYTGREDDGTGVYYYRARYYAPDKARFFAEDPIGLAGGSHAYMYGENDPVDLADPLGLWAWGQPIDQGVVDWVVGFGDAFLIPDLIRDAAGIDGGVNKCSELYGAGKLGGFIWGSVPFVARTAAAFGGTSAGRWLNANRYLRIGPGRWGRHPDVPRMSIGKGPGNPHIDLRRGAYVPPIGGPATCGCP